MFQKMHENSSSIGVEKYKNFLGGNSPRPPTITWESTKHGLSVHGPLVWTGSMDSLYGPGPWNLAPWTGSTDPRFLDGLMHL